MDGVPSSSSSGEPAGSGSASAGAGSGAVSGGSTSGGEACRAIPTCDEPDDEIVSGPSECLQDDARCYSRTKCDQTIWCTGSDAACKALPVCPPGSAEVAKCPPNADCSSVTLCGTTIYCMGSCEGPQPICDPGDKQVSGPGACLQDDAVCYSRSTCGYTIWCTGPAK